MRELGMAKQMTLPGGRVYQKREFNEPTGVTVFLIQFYIQFNSILIMMNN